MKQETVDKLVKVLEAMAHLSRESALKLKTLEWIAKKHPEIFQDYEDHLEGLRAGRSTQKSLEDTEVALRELRKELLQDRG